MKRILDQVRSEAFKEFSQKLIKGLDKYRKHFGTGRRRLLQPFLIAKVLFSCCDLFWDRAKLSERCVGTIISRGLILFMHGLPPHARALFCIGSTMAIIRCVRMLSIFNRLSMACILSIV